MSAPGTLVNVRTLQSLFEAQRAESILAEAGIATQVISHRDTAYDGLFQFTQGWGTLRVAEGDRDRATALLDASLPLAVPEEELTAEALAEPPPGEPAAQPASRAVLLVAALVGVALGAGLLIHWLR
jgi:hypothetical protein